MRFRFRIGTSDTSDSQRYGAGYGWFIDDVRIYTCPPPLPATFPFYDGFESGGLGIGWTTYTTNEGRVRVNSSYPYSGTYSVLLDDSTNNSTYSHAAIILTIDLSGQSDVDLDFWWRDFGDEDDTDDGVFLSDDLGTIWVTAMNFTGNQSSFRNEVVDVDAVAAANGLTLNDHFQIKFQFYDNYAIASDGYAIDEVYIYEPLLPDIEVYPTSFDVTLSPGQATQRTMTISNVGQGTLSFSISDVETTMNMSTRVESSGDYQKAYSAKASDLTSSQTVVNIEQSSVDSELAEVKLEHQIEVSRFAGS